MQQARRILLTALLIGFAGATLVRLGPGFGTDERELDSRYRQDSRQAIQAEHNSERNIAAFYLAYLGKLLHGDLGFSHSLNRPVAELLAERLPLTLASLGYGVGGGLLFGFLLATVTLFWRVAAYDVLGGTIAGLCVSIPSAVVALFFLWWGASGRWAIALVVFPHVYRYARNLLASAYESQHVITALAKGLGRMRVLVAHVFVPVLPQMAALAGISVTLAFAASIPIEAICDIPGIGQLAWKAALSRDLPLLVSITMLVGILTLSVNGLADLALETGASR
jgi:peptide/nickel transport system permease protein